MSSGFQQQSRCDEDLREVRWQPFREVRWQSREAGWNSSDVACYICRDIARHKQRGWLVNMERCAGNVCCPLRSI